MNPLVRFQPSLDSLGDRVTPAALTLTVPHTVAPSSIVVTLPKPQPPAPPAPTDDAFEDNDKFARAKDIGSLTGGALNSKAAASLTGLMLTDSADWFKFTTSRPGAAGSNVHIRFDHSRGDLNLRLYDSTGAVLGRSAGTGDREAVSLAGRPAGTYYVQVRGLGGAFNPSYTISAKQAVLTTTPSAPPTSPPGGPGTPGGPTFPPAPVSGFNIALRFSGLTPTQQAVFQNAANRWGQIITGDLPDAVFQGIFVDDLLIDASATPIDGVDGILGQAGPDAFRVGGAGLPVHGFMQFDTADLAVLERTGDLFSVALHEMAHVLGFGTLWQTKGLAEGIGGINPQYTGAQGTAAFNTVFGRSGASVPLEPFGGLGTDGSHFSEDLFVTELMTGFLDPGVLNPLSIVTVGAMADLGYAVNFGAADPYVPVR
ncbi:pre-peptidase C-terminal domain-containing protein [Gemmata sp.]|uniref:PPC domain-containing protein n=1 Tax=Gemmata sp. TaxID=1914242 RepID=UPI003F7151D8